MKRQLGEIQGAGCKPAPAKSTGRLRLVTNDLTLDYSGMTGIYQKRWKVEEFHKSIKSNAGLSESPTQTVRSG